MRCLRLRVKRKNPRGRAAPSGGWSLLLGDRGSVSIEAALALSSLVIVAAAFIAGIATVGAQVAAVDAASAAARAAAIGVSYSPPRGHVEVSSDGHLVTAHVSVPGPLGRMTAQAIVPAELVSEGAP